MATRKNKEKPLTDVHVVLYHDKARSNLLRHHPEDNRVMIVKRTKCMREMEPGKPPVEATWQSILLSWEFETWDKANEFYQQLTR